MSGPHQRSPGAGQKTLQLDKINPKEIKMFTNRLFILSISIALLVSACAPSAPANPADRFAGAWSGSMGFSDDPSTKLDVAVNVPTGCVIGGACGNIDNGTCQWEMILVALHGDVFEYQFAKTLRGDDPCPTGVGTGGTLTLQKDGSLIREHKTADFIATGTLTRK
jgi:hypothetical protein